MFKKYFERVEIEQNILNYKTKTITAYYGHLIVEENESDEEDEMNVTDEIEEMSSSSKNKKKECGQIADVPTADDLFDGDVIDTDVFDF